MNRWPFLGGNDTENIAFLVNFPSLLPGELLQRLEKMEYLYNHVKYDMIELDSQITQVTGRLMLLYGHKGNRAEKYNEKMQNYMVK